jgi:hypothetical protein
MVKAIVTLPNGTTITLEGTVEEVQRLLATYGLDDARAQVEAPGAASPAPAAIPEADSMIDEETESASGNLSNIVQHIRTCREARVIDKRILEDTNEMHRVLLPLYIIYEYEHNAFGLTSTEISKVFAMLNIRLARQNVMRALRLAGSKYVTKEGEDTLAPHYLLNRKGSQYLREVLGGSVKS